MKIYANLSKYSHIHISEWSVKICLYKAFFAITYRYKYVNLNDQSDELSRLTLSVCL